MKSAIIIAYHKICPITSENFLLKDLIVTPSCFEEQIRYLKKNYLLISFRDFVLGNQNDFRKPFCLISFDDAYLDNFTFAFPILKKFEIPATIFVPTGFIDGADGDGFYWEILSAMLSASRSGRLQCQRLRGDTLVCDFGDQTKLSTVFEAMCRDLKCQSALMRGQFLARLAKEIGYAFTGCETELLSWAQMREMKASGIDFGSHGHDHLSIGQLTKDAMRDDIARSQMILNKQLSQDTRGFAYPFGDDGDYNDFSREVLSTLGFEAAVTMRQDRVVQGEDFLALPRIGIGGYDDFWRFQLKITGVIPMLSRVRRRFKRFGVQSDYGRKREEKSL